MRVFGGHDYYDGALAYGSDPTVVFQRTPLDKAAVRPFAECGLSLEPGGFAFVRGKQDGFGRTERIRKNFRYLAAPRAVWFAGRRYGGALVIRSDASNSFRRESRWFWDEERFADYLNKAGLELRAPRRSGRPGDGDVDAATLREHFRREPKPSETDWLAENRVSIAVWDEMPDSRYGRYWRSKAGWLTDVDGLGDMGFASRLGPYEAFQELSMWIGGVLPRPAAATVEIRDEKTLVAKHGMDEWSFRRPPE